MRTLMLITFALLTLAGCATTSIDPETDRTVASADSESYLRKSDLRLSDYRARLSRMRAELRRNHARSTDRRRRYRDLDDVEIKLNEAREDLYELRVANQDARTRFRARLDNVMEDVNRSFTRMNAE